MPDRIAHHAGHVVHLQALAGRTSTTCAFAKLVDSLAPRRKRGQDLGLAILRDLLLRADELIE